MGFLSDNVIPGHYGKIFETDAKEEKAIHAVLSAIVGVDGIKDTIVNTGVFPVQVTVHTSKIVKVSEIQERVRLIGHHVIPKELFPL